MSDPNRHVCTICGQPIEEPTWVKVTHKNEDKKKSEDFHDEVHNGKCWKRYLLINLERLRGKY